MISVVCTPNSILIDPFKKYLSVSHSIEKVNNFNLSQSFISFRH